MKGFKPDNYVDIEPYMDGFVGWSVKGAPLRQ